MATEWETVQLSDLARRLTRKNSEGNDNVLTISARDGLVNQETYFKKRVAGKDLSKYFLLHRGNFAYNKSSSNGYPIGAIKRLEKYPKGVVSPLYICFEMLEQAAADPDYLVHFFESGQFEDEVRTIAKTGARAHGALNVRPAEFFSLSLPLPTLPEQRKIAAILSSVDEVIERTEAVIEQLQVVKKAMMQELLTRGLPGRHTRFKQTEIGEIPEEWDVVTLSDISNRITKGTTPTTYGHDYTDHGVPLLRVENITDDGRLDLEGAKFISKEAHNEFARSQLVPGDLLFSIAGALGRAALVPDQLTQGNINQAIARVCLYGSGFDRPYILYASMGPQVEHQVSIARSALAQANLNLKQVGQISIPLPAEREQREIRQALDSVRGRIAAEQRVLKAQSEVKASFMSVLLTGQLRVTPDEEAAA